MLLSKHTAVRLRPAEANFIGHMCYAAYKLWNVCNYERIHYQELGLTRYPDWYYQKSAHKGDLWYKSLPSQSAQEVLKLLDKSWKSYYALKKSGGVLHPHHPYFKKEGLVVTYMQNGLVHRPDDDSVRLSLPRQLKTYMADTYDIHMDFLYLKNQIFQSMDKIKQIKVYPPEKDGICRLIVIYEVPDTGAKEDNGRYLSIDPGLHNLLTCYDNRGDCFILGRQYLTICRRYDKEIARVQSRWAEQQIRKGVKHPRSSMHLKKLYRKKNRAVKDYMHKVTRWVTDYAAAHEIHTVVIGDIRGIRKGADLGKKTNQKLHSLPYQKLYSMLEYKLARKGIHLIRQKESYSSQCSPMSPEVSAKYAKKANRRHRGLYKDGEQIWNADAVGAYNILRKYHAVSGEEIIMPVSGLDHVTLIKVAV